MLKVMQPVLKETLEKVNLAEIASQTSKNPNIHPISEKDLSMYNKLLRKAHRTSKEWDTILEILYSGDVFPAVLIGCSKSITEVEGILCHKGELMVFTTLEKYKKFIDFLHETDKSFRYVNFASFPFDYAMDIANQTQQRMVIDIPVKDVFQKCLVYKSDKQKISAAFILRR